MEKRYKITQKTIGNKIENLRTKKLHSTTRENGTGNQITTSGISISTT